MATACGRIEDFGRGLSYQHLTQNENPEKRHHAAVIGQFGIGLKDALGRLRSPRRAGHDPLAVRRHHHRHQPKSGFDDLPTLHAIIGAPSQPDRVGTLVSSSPMSADDDIEAAKSLFLQFAGDEVLETTKYGTVLAKPRRNAPGRVYLTRAADQRGRELPVLVQHHRSQRRAAQGAEPRAQQRRPRRLHRARQADPQGVRVGRRRRRAHHRPQPVLVGPHARRVGMARRRPARVPRVEREATRRVRHGVADGHGGRRVREARRHSHRRGVRRHRPRPTQPHRPQR